MALDKECTNQGYVCGRLFAVLERIQESALGNELNRTIKDGYFATASSNPASVYPRLISLSQNHLKKIKSDGKKTTYFEILIGEIMDKLDIDFPKTLTLDEQGAFDIGYYQQKQDFFRTNKDNEKE